VHLSALAKKVHLSEFRNHPTAHATFRTPKAVENRLRRALDIVRKVQGYPAV